MLEIQAFRKAPAVCAAAAIVSLLSFGAASAATFSISGGTAGVLPGTFDTTVPGEGIVAGAGITIFGPGAGDPTKGLLASPSSVFITFEFIGKEAGFTNTANLVFLDTLLFDNNVAAGTTVTKSFNLPSDPGALPFYFKNPAGAKATNGGTIDSGLQIAFRLVSSTVAYAFFDDGGGGNPADADFDDMTLRLTFSCSPEGGGCAPQTTPLPAALPLFAGGLGVIGLLVRRRKRKAAEAMA